MNKKIIFYITGRLMMIMAAILIVPLVISCIYKCPTSLSDVFNDAEKMGFILSILLSAGLGFLTTKVFRSKAKLEGIREGFAIVAVGWTALGLFGAIPFFIYFMVTSGDYSLGSIIVTFTDACFEIYSGFTTTGASILSDIEAVPKGLLFWRSLTHWLGGMGIITLAMAIFPAMGVSGYHMFRGEVPGPTTERIQPRLAQTAAILWGVYALLTLAETVLLLLGGMDWFDSLCHTFGTMATGGFSTKNGSIGQYNSDYIDWVITIFMYFAGVNFLIHYRVLRGNFEDIFKNRELHFYTGAMVVTTIVLTGILFFAGIKPAHHSEGQYRNNPPTVQEFHQHVDEEAEKVSTLYGAFRRAAFQTAAIITTTGYGTADFDLWPDFCRFAFLFLMFWGGCAGSTGGGIKIIRIMVVLKAGWRELKKITHPHLVAPLKIGGSSMDERQVISICAFVLLFLITFIIGVFLMTLFIPDLVTAISTVVATLANIGPGLNGVGSIENYGWIPIPGKWILIVLMLLGRLELFTILLALRPSFWKR